MSIAKAGFRIGLLGYALIATMSAAAVPQTLTLMPAPAGLHIAEGRLAITPDLAIAISRHTDARLRGGLARTLARLEARTGLSFPRTPSADYLVGTTAPATGASLTIDCTAPGPAVPTLGEDETYSLEIDSTRATLRAPTVTGALRGLETLVQLLQADAGGWFVPAIRIQDRPRFPWRGLLIDVVRHWMPPEVIRRNLDAMAVVKFNVLHLHLTDDQGFRIESRRFPRLHELASDGLYYTQEQMRELVAYAAARGIRIVPEIELPGHATGFAVAYPGLVSAPGAYGLQRRWGVFDAVLDPTNEKLYPFLDAFLEELATVFPDAYVHIGGDENNGRQWSANPGIQAFIARHRLGDNAGLQAYFNRRLSEILTRHGRHLVGWGEILHPELPRDAVVHAWGPTKSAVEAARQGFRGIRSTSYYLDHGWPARDHYLADPLPADAELAADAHGRILGGEACMWAEWVTAENIDSRIWPRAAAIAERFWSPREVTDIRDMYRRLDYVSGRLEEAGSLHRRNPAAMLRRFAGDAPPARRQDLQALAGLVSAGGLGLRNQASQRRFTQFTPLTAFADCAVPEGDAGRHFGTAVEALVFTPGAGAHEARSVREETERWPRIAEGVADQAGSSVRWRELLPLAGALRTAHTAATEALALLRAGQTPPPGWASRQLDALEQSRRDIDNGVTLSVLPAVRLLVAAVEAGPRRTQLSTAEWRSLVETIAAPPRASKGR